MKGSALKHYRRKRFFYRLFMRNSPRNGAMFGIAWISMVAGVSPFILWALLFVLSGAFTSGEKMIACVVGVILMSIPAYIYGYIVAIYGVSRICQSVFKNKAVCMTASVVGCYFLPLLGAVLAPVLVRRKKFAGAVLALAGCGFYVLSYFKYFNILTCVFLGAMCYFGALAFAGDKRRFSWKFSIPFSIALVLHLLLAGYNIKLQYDVKHYRKELSQTVGHSVEIDDFWKREAQGFAVDREPLKTLIAAKPEETLPVYEYEDIGRARKMVLEYEKKFPEFVKAVDEFLQLPVSRVAHKYPEKGMLTNISAPELSAFRRGARYLAMKTAAFSDDKKQVRECNEKLVKLRDLLLHNEHVLGFLVANSVEHIRLSVLTTVLGRGTFSGSGFEELLGKPVEWEKFLRRVFGCEATAFNSIVNFVQSEKSSFSSDYAAFNTVKKYVPLFLDTHFLLDYRYYLRWNIKACSLPQDISGVEKCQLTGVDSEDLENSPFFLSGMFIPAMGFMYIFPAQRADGRESVLLAAKVMAYYQQHGKVPENLDFLPGVPLAKLDHRPLMYEKTADGFRIFSHTKDGRKPGAKDQQYTYQVRTAPKR